MTAWTFPDVWEQAADAFPAAPAAVHGERRISWTEFDRRAAALAAALLGEGLAPGAKVAQYLPNRPEYLESFFAATRVSLVPVNTNYRYLDDELTYLWDNADVEAVVFDTQYTATVERVRRRVPGVRAWFHVGPPVELGPGDAPLTVDGRRRVGKSGGDLFPHVGKGPGGHCLFS